MDVPNQPLHTGFLLLPRYTLISLSCAVSVLRMANRLSGQPLYRWSLHSVDGEPVESSDGLSLAIDGKLDETVPAKLVFACGGIEVEKACDTDVLHLLRAVAKRGIPLGALDTGSYALAAADLLNGRRCAIHWENIASLRETFPQVLVQPSLFVIDRNRYTCSGGISSLDLMLNLVEAHHGRRLARDISEQFICERIRDQQDSQRIPLHHYLGASQPRVVEAVALMESNVEEPLSMEDLAAYVGVSRRQLERLFHKHLDCTPVPPLPRTASAASPPAAAADRHAGDRHRHQLRVLIRPRTSASATRNFSDAHHARNAANRASTAGRWSLWPCGARSLGDLTRNFYQGLK